MGKKCCKKTDKPEHKPQKPQKCLPCNSTFVTFTGLFPTTPSTSLTLTLTPSQQTILSQLGDACAVRTLNVSVSIDTIAFALDESNNLILFNLANPSLSTTRPITGLIGSATEFVVGIDFRPSNGLLYLITKNAPGGGVPADTVGRIYTLNTSGTGAVATFIAELTAALIVDEYAIDFNPVLDRLRLVSHDGIDNLSVDVDTIPAVVTPQTGLSGTPPRTIAGIAYTNNFAGATSTSLFDINSARNFLVLQNPPASGVLTDVGPLGLDVSNDAGFDIQTNPVTGTNIAYAVFTVNGVTGLYNVNLSTGAATFVGSFGLGAVEIIGLALPLTPPPTLLVVLQQNGEASGISAVVPANTSQVNVPACLSIAPTDTLSIVITEINGLPLPTLGSIVVTLEIVCTNGSDPCACPGTLGNNNNGNQENQVFKFEKGSKKCCDKRK